MVWEQLKSRGISDALVLKAMATIPREKFIPKQFRSYAYDGIMFTAAVVEIPQAIFDQLKLNAILVAPVGKNDIQSLIKFRKGMRGEIFQEEILPVRFVKMLSMKNKEHYYEKNSERKSENEKFL